MFVMNAGHLGTESKVVAEILQRASQGESLSRDDLLVVMRCNPTSPDASLIRLHADGLTRKAFGNSGEVHAQIGINLATCSKGCKFCAFSRPVKRIEFSQEEVVARARAFQAEGANAIFLMTTADYKFDRFLAMGAAVGKVLDPCMPLVANVGDFDSAQARELVDAGFTAIYHVCRLREGADTKTEPSTKLATVRAAKSVGLELLR